MPLSGTTAFTAKHPDGASYPCVVPDDVVATIRATAIAETRRECAKAVCSGCRNEHEKMLVRGLWVHPRGERYFCPASAIHALAEGA